MLLVVGVSAGAGKTAVGAGALMGALVVVVLLAVVLSPEIRTGTVVGDSVTLVVDGLVTGAVDVGNVGVTTTSHVPGVKVELFVTSFRAKNWNGPPRPIF